MSFEDVGAVETFLRGGARAGAESANHGPLVVSQGVPVLVVLASEPFVVVVAGSDRALLWPLRLMGKHVSFDVLEKSAAL